jgi:WD40 repeat protein
MAAVIAASVIVAIGMSVLRQQSETARAEAHAAARFAEAQQLFALGQLELERQPGIALAYAMASLERNDHPEVRRFALRALSRGPTPMIVAQTESGGGRTELSFSRTGEWLGALNVNSAAVRLWRSDGTARQIPESGSPGNYASGQFADDERSFVVTTSDSIRMYSLPEVGAVRRVDGSYRWGFVRGASIVTGDSVPPLPDGRQRRLIRTYPLQAGAPETTVGVWAAPPGAAGFFGIDRTGEWTLGIYGGSLFENSLRQIDRPARLIVRGGDDPVIWFSLSPDESQIHVLRKSTAHNLVSRDTGVVLAAHEGAGQSLAGAVATALSPDGRRMAVALENDRAHVLDLAAPRGVDPVVARLPGRPLSVAIDPKGWWLAVQDRSLVSLWPLRWSHARVLRRGTTRVMGLAIDPLGRWMATGQRESPPELWSLTDGEPMARRILGNETFAGGNPAPGAPSLARLLASPRGDLLAAGTFSGLWLVPLNGRPERLPGFNGIVRAFHFDRTGQWLAAGGGIGSTALSAPGENVVRVWNVDTREVRVLAGDDQPITGVAFLPDGRLLSSGRAGIREWNLATGTSTLLMSDDLIANMYPSPDGRRLLLFRAGLRPGGAVGSAAIYDLKSGTTTPLASHGTLVTVVAWHPSGDQVVTGSQDGTVRIGPADGGEPHLLYGHEEYVWEVAVDPLGRFVASTSADGTARQWPMPAGQPMHMLPRAELLDRLRSLTSYRIVQDPSATSGYRVDFEPFTGWKREPRQW